MRIRVAVNEQQTSSNERERRATDGTTMATSDEPELMGSPRAASFESLAARASPSKPMVPTALTLPNEDPSGPLWQQTGQSLDAPIDVAVN